MRNFAKHHSLDMERSGEPAGQEARSSLEGRRTSLENGRAGKARLPSGRMSAEMRRSSMESSRNSGEMRRTPSVVATFKVPAGERCGSCPRGHPMFMQTTGEGLRCNACGKKCLSASLSCSICNYYKCEPCHTGVKRNSKDEKGAADENGAKKTSSCCFPIFRSKQPAVEALEDPALGTV